MTTPPETCRLSDNEMTTKPVKGRHTWQMTVHGPPPSRAVASLVVWRPNNGPSPGLKCQPPLRYHTDLTQERGRFPRLQSVAKSLLSRFCPLIIRVSGSARPLPSRQTSLYACNPGRQTDTQTDTLRSLLNVPGNCCQRCAAVLRPL